MFKRLGDRAFLVVSSIFLLCGYGLSAPDRTTIMCGERHQTLETGSYGYIQSAGYPDNATSTEGECSVSLVIKGPASVQLTVDGKFYIPTIPPKQRRCHKDSKMFWINDKGANFENTVCDKLSNGSIVQTLNFTETESKVKIRFSNMMGVEDTYFRVKYIVMRPIDYGNTDSNSSYPVESEGYIISHLSSMTTNTLYRPNISSSLTLTGLQPRSEVVITFLMIDLNGIRNCKDFLTVTSGLNESIKVCGNSSTAAAITTLTVKGSDLTFQFISHRKGMGFILKYIVIEPTPIIEPTMISSPSTKQNMLAVYIGIGGGVTAIIMIAVVISILVVRRKRPNRQRVTADQDLHRPGDTGAGSVPFISDAGIANTPANDGNGDCQQTELIVYSNTETLNRLTEEESLSDMYAPVLAANKRPKKHIEPQELIENDLYGT